MIAAAAALFLASRCVGALLGRERRRRPLLELGQLGLGVLEGDEARVERALLGGRLLAQLVGPRARVLGLLVERGQGRLVERDLVGQRLVLLTDVDEVAHLGQQVGERAARQERLEERGAVGVVGAADALREQSLALGELRLLGDLARLDDHELRVEALDLRDERVVVGLDHVDLGLHVRDLHADLGEVGVDPAQLRGRALDLRGQGALERVEVRDPLLLGRDFLLQLRLARLRVGQLVASDARRRRGRTEQPHDQREEEKEGTEPATGSPSGGCRSGVPAPPIGWGHPAFGLDALHVGDVIVRVCSVVARRWGSELTVTPAGESPSKGAQPQTTPASRAILRVNSSERPVIHRGAEWS